MNPEIKTKWLDALRSGKYKQGRGRLRDLDDKYCCLGVLCDIISPDRWKPTGRDCFPWSYNGESTIALGLYVKKVAKISAEQSAKLLVKNDNGESFLEIADYIEKEF